MLELYVMHNQQIDGNYWIRHRAKLQFNKGQYFSMLYFIQRLIYLSQAKTNQEIHLKSASQDFIQKYKRPTQVLIV